MLRGCGAVMASLRTSATVPLLALCCMLHVAAAGGESLPAWTSSSSSATGRAHRRRTQPAAEEAPLPRRSLQQIAADNNVPLAGLAVQVFSPYNSPYTLPIPASARPKATTTAPSVNYPQASSGGVMALAKATTNFALRFTGSINIDGVAPANLTFMMDSDDGSLLSIDGKVIVSNPGQHGFNGGKSGMVVLSPGVHDIKIDYFQAAGRAGIVLKYSVASRPPYYGAVDGAVVPSKWFTHLPAGYLPGLAVQTFVPYCRPYALPLPLVAPTGVTSAPDVNFPDVSAGGLMTLANATSNFALRFSGVLNIGYQPLPSSRFEGYFYKFTLASDDGAMLLFPSSSDDPNIITNASGRHAFKGGTKSSALQAFSSKPNLVAFAIDYSQEAGMSGVVLNVTLQNPYYGPPGPSMVVPASWFAHRPLTAPPPPPPPPPPPHCAGESGRGGATNKQCAGPYADLDQLVDCCPGYECEFVTTEGPDYGAHFCTAVQCSGHLYDYASEGIKCCPSSRNLSIAGFPEVCCTDYTCSQSSGSNGGIGTGDCAPPPFR